MTLDEIFEVTWDITELQITARDEKGLFLHEWIYAYGREMSMNQRYDIKDGKLTYIDRKINCHGEATRRGPEMAWGVDKKRIHKELREALITVMSMYMMSQGRGTSCRVDVTMHSLTAEAVAGRDRNDDQL